MYQCEGKRSTQRKITNSLPIACDNSDYMYSKMLNFLVYHPKDVRFKLPPKLERAIRLHKDVRDLKRMDYRPVEEPMSFVVDEDSGASKRLTEDEFWEYIFHGEWGRQVRVTSGQLLKTIMSALHELVEDRILGSYKITHFDSVPKEIPHGAIKVPKNSCKVDVKDLPKTIHFVGQTLQDFEVGQTHAVAHVPAKMKIEYFSPGQNFIPSFDSIDDQLSGRNWSDIPGYGDSSTFDDVVLREYIVHNGFPKDDGDNENNDDRHYEDDDDDEAEVDKASDNSRNRKDLSNTDKSSPQLTTPSSEKAKTAGSQLSNGDFSQSQGNRKDSKKLSGASSMVEQLGNGNKKFFLTKGNATSGSKKSVAGSATEVLMGDEILHDSLSNISLDSELKNIPHHNIPELAHKPTKTVSSIHRRLQRGLTADPDEQIFPSEQQNVYRIEAKVENFQKSVIKRPEDTAAQTTQVLTTTKKRALRIRRKDPRAWKVAVEWNDQSEKAQEADFDTDKLWKNWSIYKIRKYRRYKTFVGDLTRDWSLDHFDHLGHLIDKHSEAVLLPRIASRNVKPPKQIKVEPLEYVNREPSIPKLAVATVPPVVNTFLALDYLKFKRGLAKACRFFLVRKEQVTVADGIRDWRTVTSVIINRSAPRILLQRKGSSTVPPFYHPLDIKKGPHALKLPPINRKSGSDLTGSDSAHRTFSSSSYSYPPGSYGSSSNKSRSSITTRTTAI